MSKKPVHDCNCGKRQVKLLVTCSNCQEALRGSNGRKYPIHVVPVEVTMQQITEWRNDGYSINIEQPAYNT